MDFNFPTQKQHRIENIFHHDPQCRWDHTHKRNTLYRCSYVYICAHAYIYIYIDICTSIIHMCICIPFIMLAYAHIHYICLLPYTHIYIFVLCIYSTYQASIYIGFPIYIYLDIYIHIIYMPTTRMNPPPNHLPNNLCLFFFRFPLP